MQPPFDLPTAHRHFAVEFNNAAWDLVEAPDRTPEQVEQMVRLAHAAATHWLAVGEPIHHERAWQLLAFACSLAGQHDAAISFAGNALALVASHPEAQTPFDIACTTAAMARALRAGGRADAEVWHGRAVEAAAALEADEKALINRLM